MSMGGEGVEAASDMNILIRRGYRPGDKVLLYDGVCNLCNGWVNFVIDRDPQSRYKFAALQGEAGRALMTRVGRDPDDLSTLVLVEWHHCDPQGSQQGSGAGKELVFCKSEAVLRVVEDVGGRTLGAIASLARTLLPRVLRDFVYAKCVAPNRYLLFGKSASCRRITPALKPRFLDLDQVLIAVDGDPESEGRGR